MNFLNQTLQLGVRDAATRGLTNVGLRVLDQRRNNAFYAATSSGCVYRLGLYLFLKRGVKVFEGLLNPREVIDNELHVCRERI